MGEGEVREAGLNCLVMVCAFVIIFFVLGISFP